MADAAAAAAADAVPTSEGKITVAVDLDEVIGKFVAALAEFCNKKYGSTQLEDEFISYDFMHVWNISKDETQDRVDAFLTEAIETVPVIEGAFEALRALHQSGKYRLVLVTSRQHMIAERTRKWLDKHYPGIFDAVVFGNHYGRTGPKRSKAEMCKELGVRVLIDDRVRYARATQGAVEEILLFGTYAWNRLPEEEEAALHESIHRVANWEEVLARLEARYGPLPAPAPEPVAVETDGSGAGGAGAGAGAGASATGADA